MTQTRFVKADAETVTHTCPRCLRDGWTRPFVCDYFDQPMLTSASASYHDPNRGIVVSAFQMNRILAMCGNDDCPHSHKIDVYHSTAAGPVFDETVDRTKYPPAAA